VNRGSDNAADDGGAIGFITSEPMPVSRQIGTRLRFAFKWTDPKTGEAHSRAGMQSYRVEAAKLAETWRMLQPLGSAWTDVVAQEHWTSPPPMK
jgi:hypothetical protein